MNFKSYLMKKPKFKVQIHQLITIFKLTSYKTVFYTFVVVFTV